ncbi:DnaJ domain-containing protein [Marinobacter sp. AL4B]|uniref:DnaJ domain-containing protein n=1 Tax=Marinobacter sp. AL4B TaxID=2871173 RepID=UPI001CAA7F7C|nr:DnaJ domain-containing protein [Marinobacter sp. AL4B]MBZ0334988.1 DnaJ domain-containing protein [Marinobacter sp. AL4B]
MTNATGPSLPASIESVFSDLLHELSSCGHQANTLIERARLPRRCRKPLFFFLGYIAKADGRVMEGDIRYAELLMKALRLSSRQRKKAIEQYQLGKDASGTPLHRGLWNRIVAKLSPGAAIKMAMCLCHGAQILGKPSKERRYRCEDAIDNLGLPMAVSDDIFASYASKVWIRSASIVEKPKSYEQACEILGVTRRDSFETIKRTYRKRLSTCHPDKLSQQKLSPTELDAAKDQLLRYQQAWELIKRHNR